jgi:cell division protein FtsQ
MPPRQAAGVRKGRIKWKRVALLACLLACIALLVWVYFYTDTLNVDQVEVRGNSRLEAWYVEMLSGLNSHDRLLTFDRGRVVSNLLADPWIKEVRVLKGYPNRVILEIKEREPVAQVLTEAGYCLVDEEGVLVAASPTPWPAYTILEGLPVEGLAVSDTIPGEAFTQEMEVYTLMDEVMRARTAYVLPDPEHGMVLVSREGVQIYLGDLEDLEKKLQIAFLILENELKEYKQLAYIDVSNIANPVIRPL